MADVNGLRRALQFCYPRAGGPWLREFASCVVLASACALTVSALGQTNVEPDSLQPDNPHNLTPLGSVLRTVLWAFGGILLVIAVVVTILRRRLNPSLYKTVPDEHWQDDSFEEAGDTVEESEVVEACEDFGKPKQAADESKTAVAEPAKPKLVRQFTPASGPVWEEPRLNAFLGSCLKANCLGRTWQEEAAHRQQGRQASVRLPDPREAELLRRLKARWQEFYVDPETGVFTDHIAAGADSRRVCIIKVSRERRAVTQAALNAGFVIECVGRYLQNTDLVYPVGPGSYHAVSRQEFAALSEDKKKRVLRLTKIAEPWQAMIAG